MKPLKKETIDKAIVRLRDKFSLENLRKRQKFEKLTSDKHKSMLNFIETMAFILLDSYIRNNKHDL
jgi:hypothetical protein